MRWFALLAVTGCGAPIYFPVEPPPFEQDPLVADTGQPDTGAPDTGQPTDPWPESTPTGGGLPCSFYGFFYADLTVRNLGATDLVLYWRDFYCIEHHYASIPGGTDYLQGTYDNQAWVVRDPYGALIGSKVIHEAEVLWEVP